MKQYQAKHDINLGNIKVNAGTLFVAEEGPYTDALLDNNLITELRWNRDNTVTKLPHTSKEGPQFNA